MRAAAVVLLLAGVPLLALSQGSAVEPRDPGKASTAIRGSVPPRAAAPATGVKREAGPRWADLSANQHEALRPLASNWSSLSADQKRKWIAMSRNHDNLSPEERTRLHSRMSEWASLSTTERAQARLNYSGSRDLSPQDKSAQWRAYQALPAAQKKALAGQHPVYPAGVTVAPTKPTQRRLLAQPHPDIEQPPLRSGHPRAKPKLVPGDKLDANTLLPQQPSETPNKQGS